MNTVNKRLKDSALASHIASVAHIILGLMIASSSQALPTFARQTGQNCVACHAGGQFPELTPYGRMFKLTGYTIGERTMPISVMGVVAGSKMSNIDAVNTSLVNHNAPATLGTPLKNGALRFETASLFLAGKISDNIGAFTQITYDNYGLANANGDNVVGHTSADNMDFRWADQIVSTTSDMIYGVSLNNGPSVSDPWNTSWAWSNYVPATGGIGSNAYLDATTAYPNSGLPGKGYAGLTGYLYLNKNYYAELGFYRTANKNLRFLNARNDQIDSYLKGTDNPYWRFAYTKDWGAHNLMVGTSGMLSKSLDTGLTNFSTADFTDSANFQRVRSAGIDSQYQFLLDPHTVTAQFSHQKQSTDPSLNNTTATAANTNMFRLKGSYVYLAKYGGSVSYFNLNGDDTNTQQGKTLEVFYMPIQYVRAGIQYTSYMKLPYMDRPSDANTLRLYVWTAY